MPTVPTLRNVSPEDAALDAWHLRQIDRVVAEGLAAGHMPGCVVCVGRQGRIVLRKAYGRRQVAPAPEAMTTRTVFDLASLTKPIATATSIMRLVEDGKLRLDDPAGRHLPEFTGGGKERITVAQLLTHQSGLTPDNPLRDYDRGPEEAWRRICALKLRAEPGKRFLYSDVGYIVLAELVRRVSGMGLDEFARRRIFEPLGMSETGFLPPEALRPRAAPTDQRDGRWIRGEVHDPRAWRLGGVAGHAGLFSTACDLAVFASMMLGRGAWGDVRVLGERTFEEMTRPREVAGGGLRALGWDVRSGYSSHRGEAFTPRAFGHGGFTGTALWIDPDADLFVIFLSNRLHPDGKGEVNTLAGRIGTIAAAAGRLRAIEDARPPVAPPDAHRGRVLTGLDVLQRDGFRQLAGRRVGLITNHTGLNRAGVSNVQLLAGAPGVTLVKLFSPEHGLEGTLDQDVVADARQAATDLPVLSLYGKTRRPTKQMLAGLDTLVFDLQDVGTRFYTYPATMAYAMEAAAECGLRFVVLDRPNPINGADVAGCVLEDGRESFVGFHTLPVRHGMTIGELARLYAADRKLALDLHVVPMAGWRRGMLLDATGLRWVDPSPNMRSLTEALLYPGIGLLETTNLSVGRGTATPFELIGAPWIDEARLAEELTASKLPGIRFEPVRFTPTASKFAGEPCGGVRMHITSRRALRPVRTGLEIALTLRRLYGRQWQMDAMDRLLLNGPALKGLLAGRTVPEIEWAWQDRLEEFLQRRSRVLLY